MNKSWILLTLVVLTLVLWTEPVSAGLRYGVKGGLNLSSVSFSKTDLNAQNRLGYFVGPTAELMIPLIGLGVDASALYSETGSSINEGNKQSQTIQSISVPLNLKLAFGVGKLLGIYAAAGPQFDFNVSNVDLTNDFKMQRYNTSVNVGAGIQYANHFQIGLNYNFSVSKVADSNVGDNAMNQHIWQLSLAYFF